VPPDPRPVQPSTVLARSRTLRAGILDGHRARRSADRQVGTKGWSVSIEQRDVALDLKLTRFRGTRQAFNGGFSDAQDASALFT
jgi:hypothetical protein